MDNLRERVKDLAGSSLGEHVVEFADDFSYTDPVDESVATQQGVRIGFLDGGRIVYRLSGTGTEGATLRVYLEHFEKDPERLFLDVADALGDLVEIARSFAEIKGQTGRDAPDVIT
jgi:phosphoglucomutase